MLLAQSDQGTALELFNRAGTLSYDGRYLFDGQATDEAQRQHFPLLIRQHVEEIRYLLRCDPLQYLILGRGLLPSVQVRFEGEFNGSASLPPVIVHHAGVGNGEDERAQAGDAPGNRLQPWQDAEEDFLHDGLRIFYPAGCEVAQDL